MGCLCSCLCPPAKNDSVKSEQSLIKSKATKSSGAAPANKYNSTMKKKKKKLTSHATAKKTSIGAGNRKKASVATSKAKVSAVNKNCSKTTSKRTRAGKQTSQPASSLKPSMVVGETMTVGLVDGLAASTLGDVISKASSVPTGTGRLKKRTNIRFNSSRANPLTDSEGEAELKTIIAGRRLGRDQKLTVMAVGGNAINADTTKKLMGKKYLESLRQMANLRSDIALLASEPFCSLHLIVPGIYLTGSMGLQRELMAEANIWVVINATWELPLLAVQGILTYRVPCEDDAAHKIDVYFDDVADLMEAARRRGFASVVHCAAGVSRSSTLVLAYLLKYTDMTLLEAFGHTRAIRSCIRPNMGFMAQLIDYERQLRGHTSVHMVTVRDKEHRISVTVPDFYQEECKDLYEWEVGKQLIKK